MGASLADAAKPRLPSVGGRPAAGGDSADRAANLNMSDAVLMHGDGTTTEVLDEFVGLWADYCRGRIRGNGAEQYADINGQAYERMTIDRLINELVDELADVSNYAAMLAVKIMSMKGALDG